MGEQSGSAQEWALMTVHLVDKPLTPEGAATALGVEVEAIDHRYGVVPVDAERGLFAVKVRADRIVATSDDEYHGPFSNPRISHF